MYSVLYYCCDQHYCGCTCMYRYMYMYMCTYTYMYLLDHQFLGVAAHHEV